MIATVLAAALAFTPQDATNAFAHASAFVAECTPRDAGTIRGRLAANWILDRVSILGADVRRDVFTAQTPKGDRSFTNLTCGFAAKPGEPWTILVSHYDTKPGANCPGANDGASTTGLLIALADAFVNREAPNGNVMLAWVDGEECMNSYDENDGFWGSKRMAAQFKGQGMDIRAVVCLDMLGDKDLKITIPSNVSGTLAKIVQHASRRAGLAEGTVVCIPEIVHDDHVAFMNAGYSAVNLIDFEYGSAPGLNDYWHTPKDTVDKLSVDSLQTTGRLVASLLTLLCR